MRSLAHWKTMLLYISNQPLTLKREIKCLKSRMNSVFYIVMSVVTTILILIPSHIATATQPSESHNTTINNYNKIDRGILVKKNLAAVENFGNKTEIISKQTLNSNPNFDNRSGSISFQLPSFWNDPNNSCDKSFKCGESNSTGWKDRLSFQISTTNNTNNTWSSIYGKEIRIFPKEEIQLVSHMKLNEWAIQSHIAFEGYNKNSKQWYQIAQCPSATNGPLEWREFSCEVTIPININKIRPVFNAGWSSSPTKQATTWFDSVYLINPRKPVMSDQNLKAELVVQGLKSPTSMAFLGPNDFLVLEKNKGTVQRIVNGVMLAEPLIDLDVANTDGLLGIAIEKNMTTNQKAVTQNSTYVFLYFTASKEHEDTKGEPQANHLYRYELINNTLVNPKLLLSLPAGFMHNGGPILIGPDKNIYISVGEVRYNDQPQAKSKALNINGSEPDGRGGILRVNENGSRVGPNPIFGEEEPLDKYFAYGIRNSFGIAFDPITSKLWDTENGPDFGDEINLLDPGFNSGWKKIQGFWKVAPGEKMGNQTTSIPDNRVNFDATGEYSPPGLVTFGGKGKYSSPEFTWKHTVGPTALEFLTTNKLGKQYENDIVVADVNTGRIYHFELNQNRTGLLLNGSLGDKVGDTYDELEPLVFARGFGMITDLEIGPDGYLYIVQIADGKIYRVLPKNADENIRMS
jgi:glucose/arabinose dehydrogenase